MYKNNLCEYFLFIQMVKLICTAHNASVALLFELLAIAHFLPTVIEKTLVTCSVRQLNLVIISFNIYRLGYCINDGK